VVDRLPFAGAYPAIHRAPREADLERLLPAEHSVLPRRECGEPGDCGCEFGTDAPRDADRRPL
jgi:hypothetical protein